MLPLNKFKRLDARPLLARGEEPFAAIRRKIDTLKPGEGLVVIAPFLPSPLIERLRAEGFATKLERGEGADWIVYFWRETAPPATLETP